MHDQVSDLFVQLWLAHGEHLLQRSQTVTLILTGCFVKESFESGLLERFSQRVTELSVVKLRHLLEKLDVKDAGNS